MVSLVNSVSYQRVLYIHVWYHSLHCWRKHFCRYSLHAFITEEISKHHIKDFFKDCFKKHHIKGYFKDCFNGKQSIIILNKGEYVIFKNVEGKEKQNHQFWFMQILKLL